MTTSLDMIYFNGIASKGDVPGDVLFIETIYELSKSAST